MYNIEPKVHYRAQGARPSCEVTQIENAEKHKTSPGIKYIVQCFIFYFVEFITCIT